MTAKTDILVVPPTIEPLTRTQAKLHLRSTTSAEDALVDPIIAAARAYVEDRCQRAIVLQTRRLLLDRFPNWCGGDREGFSFSAWRPSIDIYRAPVRAVQSIQYLDDRGVLQTLATNQHRVDLLSLPARITPEYGVIWPTTYPVPNAVTVNYTAGHLVPFTADAATDVLTAPGHGFANADVTQLSTLGALPTGLAAATNYYVRDAAADTLKLTATSGGAAIDITANGTAPNFLGALDKRIEQAMQLLIQYFEQRDANEDYREAAEIIMSPLRVVSF